MAWPPKDRSIELSGDWLIRADPDDCGVAERWWEPRDDPADWRPIRIPCAWQIVLGTDYHGVAWLRRTVRIPRRLRPRREGDHLWLRFESVATDVRAWVDGVEVGRHVGDYVPFQFDITPSPMDRRLSSNSTSLAPLKGSQ